MQFPCNLSLCFLHFSFPRKVTMQPVRAPRAEDARGQEAEFKWEENTKTDSWSLRLSSELQPRPGPDAQTLRD